MFYVVFMYFVKYEYISRNFNVENVLLVEFGIYRIHKMQAKDT